MMLPALSSLTAHLWQSTYCVALAWLVAFALRKNRAAVRYRVWMAASVKFLIPFSLLVDLGHRLGGALAWHPEAAIMQQPVSFVMEQVAPQLAIVSSTSLPQATPAASNWLAPVLLGLWCFGIATGIVFWLQWMWRIGNLRRAAKPLDLAAPLEVRSAAGRLEPGVVGIWRPVLLLPEGITERLTPQQLDAVIAHEMCHVRRRDNLTAAIHMAVETVFWFHPLVRWMRTRLIEERERACDEEVLLRGSAPLTYAEGILEVCKYYAESPVCMAGISGANLRRRIENIMENRFLRNLSPAGKLLLAATGMLALATPIAIGILSAPASHAQEKIAIVASASPASVKAPQAMLPARRIAPPILPDIPHSQTNPGSTQFITASIAEAQVSQSHPPLTNIGPESVMYQSVTFWDLVERAWNVSWYQIVWPSEWTQGAPVWSPAGWPLFGRDRARQQPRYDISATMPAGTTPEQMQAMMRGLFASRLRMSTHWETQTVPIYALKIADGGVKFQSAADPSAPQMHLTVRPDGWEVTPRFPRDPVPGPSGMTIAQLTQWFSPRLDLRMVDMTGLAGVYDFHLIIPGNPPLTVAPDAAAQWSNAVFIDALQTQLGLSVEKTTMPIQMLVIDSLQRTPVAAR